MSSYYDTNKPTTANSKDFILEGEQHFPNEGLYIGELGGGSVPLPALVDLSSVKGLCLLYNNESLRIAANRCLERLAWRLAVTVPSHLCDIVMYNGGNPGDSFNTHTRMNKFITGNREDRVLYDGLADTFDKVVDTAYASIVQRMSTISFAGKKTLVEFNESLGNEARTKYQFFILTDFPRKIKPQTVRKLARIVDSGSRAGIYVLMSWNMNAEFEDEKDTADPFNPQSLLGNMELLFPQGDTFCFRNSGHDDLLNKFTLSLDDSVVSPTEANKWIDYVNQAVIGAMERARPKNISPDFESLIQMPYEPLVSEFSVTMGLDLEDKHPVDIRFNSKDYIHAFVLGKSGSGKSSYINCLLACAILKYSPEDLMLYLMDFKGVEFNRYRGLKHTKAVLVDNSDPQMTLEVLRELREENRQRVKLWQKEGVSNIKEYNKKHTLHRKPMILFVADECQVMFKSHTTNETERLIQQEITEILNIIATQGRSQGIHMLLATQQLDETDISGQILKNLSECFLMMSAPGDSERLVPDSSEKTWQQIIGVGCYYHNKQFESQVQSYFANDEKLAEIIAAAQTKAADLPGNGAHYFCGSSLFFLDQHKDLIEHNDYGCPIALVGQNIGINSGATTLPLRKDFFENILVWGANKEEQAQGVLLNALMSLMLSYRQQGVTCRFIVIDCLTSTHSRYKPVLAHLEEKGLCRIVERQSSGSVLKELVDDVQGDFAIPTVLAVFGAERFIEVKRKMPLVQSAEQPLPDTDDETLSFDMSSLEDLMGDTEETTSDNMTYPKALMYLLEEGPMHDVHILMQVDKPQDILFTDDYDVEAATKFRHKLILRSENKHLAPFRFSRDIDVERLGDEEERMRAWYYPEGDDPILFTPYQMPDTKTIQ